MFCPKCGKEIADGSKACPMCGTKFEADQTIRLSSVSSWDSGKLAVGCLSALSLLSLFMHWFQVRYLEFFSDRSGYSFFDILTQGRKILSYMNDFTGGETVRLSDLLPGEVTGIVVGVMVCAVLFLAALIQLVMQDKADIFCAAAIFGAPFSLTVLLMLNANQYIYVSSWPWIFIALCVVDICAYTVFIRKRA